MIKDYKYIINNEEIMSLYHKYREIIVYLIVGVLTTVVSLVSYYLLRIIINNYQVCTVLSWICAVLFAYITNRKFVFESKNNDIIKEFSSFVGSRIFKSGLVKNIWVVRRLKAKLVSGTLYLLYI